jgi:hypothetical protein
MYVCMYVRRRILSLAERVTNGVYTYAERRHIYSYITAYVLRIYAERRRIYSYITAYILRIQAERRRIYSYITAYVLRIHAERRRIYSYITAYILRIQAERRHIMMIILLLFLQKQNLAFAVYLFGSVLSSKRSYILVYNGVCIY